MTRKKEIDNAAVAYSNETEFDGGDYICSVAKEKAFIAGAQWADEHPNEANIKWQTGVPKEEGVYIVTTDANEVECFVKFSPNSKECVNIFKDDVIAWCPLSDIEPYKEGKK